jgi:thiosulfate/3-mercaptopyruvate sulfurtransferase
MPQTRSRHFVDAGWLNAERGKPDLAIVDGSWYLPPMKRDGKAEYLAAHIPGAVHFDIDEIADHTSTLPHMLPSPEVFALHMARLGISDGMRIVVYDGAGLFAAPRVWWTFKAFGVNDAFILEGGFPEWRARKLPEESGTVRREPGHFTPKFDASVVADLEDVEAALATNSAQVIDARPAARFRGEAPEPRAGVASGHMPGSLSVPFDTIVDGNRLASPEKIEQAFRDGGVNPDKPMITSCGSGVSAAILWLALDSIGKKPKAIYDGSWSEWGTRPGQPIATGPAKKP